MTLLRLDNVSLAYGHLPLLAHVDFQIEAGERVCLVGRNGTGKSTLLRAITGAVLPDGTKLGRASLRGVASDGMILSETEIALGDDAGGIIEVQGEKLDWKYLESWAAKLKLGPLLKKIKKRAEMAEGFLPRS